MTDQNQREFAPLNLDELNRVNSDRQFAPLIDERRTNDIPLDEATARAFGLFKNQLSKPAPGQELQPTGNFAPFSLSEANRIHTGVLPYRPRPRVAPLRIPQNIRQGDASQVIYFDDLE